MEEDEYYMSDDVEIAQSDEDKDWGEDVFKKWFRASGKGGFLSLRPWWEAGKLSVDIGELASGGGLQSHTNVWCSMVGLAVYLKAVYDGTAERLYPADSRKGVASPEGFTYYGGATTASGDVSRILKIHHWQNGDHFDRDAFAWKTGIFEGRKSKQGAYIPDMNKPKSTNLIKISRLEMAEMHFRLDLGLQTYPMFVARYGTGSEAVKQFNLYLAQLNGRAKR